MLYSILVAKLVEIIFFLNDVTWLKKNTQPVFQQILQVWYDLRLAGLNIFASTFIFTKKDY